MDVADPLVRLRNAALQAIVDELRAMFDVGRCTLRRDVPGEPFPVVHEALAPGVGSLIGDTSVSLAGQPVVREGGRGVGLHDLPALGLQGLGPQAVQPFCDVHGIDLSGTGCKSQT